MEWIKRNGPLAAGIGLPVALIIFFALAAWVPTLFVASPKYDILYLANYNEYAPGLRFTVQDKHISFSFSGANYGYNAPKLYRYSPASGELKTITLPIPEVSRNTYGQAPQQPAVVMPIAVPEIEALTIDTSNTAPDGYVFRIGYGNSPGLAEALFFSSSYRSVATLAKDGRVIKVPSGDSIYSYANIKFIGWVVP